MNSFFQRRIDKAKDQMAELEDEMKLLQLRTKLISEKGLALVQKISSLDELDSLEDYTKIYRYLSKYTKMFSEFNCNLEILLFTDGLMNELNEMTLLECSPREMKIQEKENLNSVNPDSEVKSKEVNELSEDIVLPSTKCVFPKEKINESMTNVKQKECPKEKENFGNVKNKEKNKEFFNVNTEFANSDEVVKNILGNNQNVIDDTYKTIGCLKNNKQYISALNSVESNSQVSQKASDCHNFSVNSLTSIIKPESNINYNNNPLFMSGFSPHENNFLHLCASNSFPAENNYWQISQEMGKQLQNFPFNSGSVYQSQIEPYNFCRSNRSDFYLPSLQSQKNFNIWNNEYHYSNFQSWNSPYNQILTNPSLQYIFPCNSNNRWPLPRYAFNSVQATQYSSKLPDINSSVSVNESNCFQQTLKEKKMKSNCTNSDRSNGKNEDNPTECPKQDKQSIIENLEQEHKLKSKISIKLLNFSREVGTKHNVTITYSNSPDEFYVHVNCEELVLMNVMNKQLMELDPAKEKAEPQEILRNYFDRKIAFAKNIGCYALGFCAENSSWNRLKILDWRFDSEDEMIRVFLIDYGNSIDLPLSMIQPMDSIYMTYPQFSQKCYLSDVSMTRMNPDSASALSEEGKMVFEILIGSIGKKGDLSIEIMERDDSDENKSLGVRLILSDLGICINDKLRKLESSTSISNSKDKDMTNKETSDNVSVLDFDNFLPQFSIGEKISVKVTCILRVNRFFCVKNYEKMNEKDVLKDLAKSLNSEKKISLDTPPKVGELILGKYTDLLYYRAKVIKSEPDSDCYKVLFLDYGNTEKVSWKDMKKIEKESLTIPFQMIECHLDSIELSSETNEPLEAINYFTKKIEEDSVTIEIKRILDSKRGVYGVDVYDKYGNNIACELVSKKYCVFFKRN